MGFRRYSIHHLDLVAGDVGHDAVEKRSQFQPGTPSELVRFGFIQN